MVCSLEQMDTKMTKKPLEDKLKGLEFLNLEEIKKFTHVITKDGISSILKNEFGEEYKITDFIVDDWKDSLIIGRDSSQKTKVLDLSSAESGNESYVHSRLRFCHYWGKLWYPF